eukprot:c16939_g1_i1 orf=433-1338(-)
MVGYSLPATLQKPAWLEGLLSEKFFSPCGSHSTYKKNERNIYCLDCSLAICQHCLPYHPHPHRLLQVRRYVYHDVIRMQDIQKLVDCALVQPYIINSAKVVFLNQRPQPRPSKGQGNMCETCERSLQDSYKYCSVACKVEAVVKQGKDLQGLLRLCNQVQMPDLYASSSSSLALPAESATMATKGGVYMGDDEEHEEQEQLSPNSVHRGPNPNSPTSSSSTANDGILWGGTTALVPVAMHTSKKPNALHLSRKSMFPSCKEQSYKHGDGILHSFASEGVTIRTMLPCIKRRKGIPRRSPIF